MRKLFVWLHSVGSSVPLLGPLLDCSMSNITEALTEVGATVFFATMPLWFLPAFGRFFFTHGVRIEEMCKGGELFIYSAALSGPLVYMIMKKYGERRANFGGRLARHLSYSISFPYGFGFVVISLIVCIFSGFAFAYLNNPNFKASEGESILNYDGIMTLSWVISLVSTSVLFCVTAYKNMLENVLRDSQPKQEKAFLDQWLDEKE